jgi:beta-mannosidase
MPTVPVGIEIVSRREVSRRCHLTAVMTNHGNTIALLCHLQLRRRGDDERVLPVYYSDNYISLLPSESRTISIEASQEDLNGQEPRIVVDGWNVTDEAMAHGHAR